MNVILPRKYFWTFCLNSKNMQFVKDTEDLYSFCVMFAFLKLLATPNYTEKHSASSCNSYIKKLM